MISFKVSRAELLCMFVLKQTRKLYIVHNDNRYMSSINLWQVIVALSFRIYKILKSPTEEIIFRHFSSNWKNTIETRLAAAQDEIGQRNHLSLGDIEQARILYNCPRDTSGEKRYFTYSLKLQYWQSTDWQHSTYYLILSVKFLIDHTSS